MQHVVLIGNAPSSGSTYLSQLLDSTIFSASGPELNLFSNRHLYGQTALRGSSLCGDSNSLHTARNCVVTQALPAYGLDKDGLLSLLGAADGITDFCQVFAQRFLALRGKDDQGVVFEKTPQNINALALFLDHVAEGRFVHIVRNPAYVYSSLLRRGFPPFVAAFTWLFDVASYLPYAASDRVLLVHYEELVAKPVHEVSRILSWVFGRKIELDEREFAVAYKGNSYLNCFSGHVATWSVKTHGQFANANEKQLPASIWQGLAGILDCRISPEYAGLFGIPTVSFRDALKALGYENLTATFDRVSADRSLRRPDRIAETYLWKKYLFSTYDRRRPLSPLTFLRPVVCD